ncbi:MAG: hypothetical protein MZV64_39175 [Ignavibacteriales bacterium]|nr:hypothetical protein [Ignavibacteriales bacterium]
MELLPIIKKQFPFIEIIILTAYGRIEDGVNVIKEGAFDYIVKGDEDNKLILALGKNASRKSQDGKPNFSPGKKCIIKIFFR